jgi:Holliday junction resolvase
MMTPEKKVKAKVVEILKGFGAYYFYASTGGYGASGVPDIICCYKGRFIGIECKAGKGKTTALQEKNLNNIMTAGGTALVINEDNIEEVRMFMGYLLRGGK